MGLLRNKVSLQCKLKMELQGNFLVVLDKAKHVLTFELRGHVTDLCS